MKLKKMSIQTINRRTNRGMKRGQAGRLHPSFCLLRSNTEPPCSAELCTYKLLMLLVLA
ncbi:hypothetical protein SAMN05518847_1044 [Paenibacillus sp. OV219]|nr:hypothetical protein SAMN05518847_1044 [Paenibacillus sp. OV219]